MTTKQKVYQNQCLTACPPTNTCAIFNFQFQQITKKTSKMEQKLLRDIFCFQCSLQFNGKAVYDLHQLLVHGGKTSFKCDICDKVFSLKGNLKKHTDSAHEGKKPFKCNICTSSFSEKGSLNRHIESIHEGKKPFKCSFCDASFTKQQCLKRVVY